MAITFDSAASNSSGASVTQPTLSHILGAGSNRMVVALPSTERGGTEILSVISSITYNGTAMIISRDTSLDSPNFDQACSAYLGETWLPTAGTYNVILTWTQVNESTMLGIISLAGVKDQAPEAVGSNVGTANVTSGSVSITTITNNAWLVGCIHQGAGAAVIALTGSTVRYTTGAGSTNTGGDKAVTTAGATTFAWTSGTSKRWAGVVLAFEEATTGTNYNLNLFPSPYFNLVLASLIYNRKLITGSGSYIEIGQDATLNRTYILSASPYSYNLIGMDIGMDIGMNIIQPSIGGANLTLKQFHRLEKNQLEYQRRSRMIALDDDEIITLL